jgi:protoporphyrin/coproporphyrin ferrochelatase
MQSSVGVLLVQLGTPDESTPKAVRPYLRQFLSDPRVIEEARTLRWKLILNLAILPFRPAQSAAKYRRIWDPVTGSPLLHNTRLQTEALQRELPDHLVRFGMQIGNPSVSSVVREMIQRGIDRLIVLPMFPQYSATTTASAYDCLFQALMRERRVPAIRVIPPYYEDPGYLDAMVAVIRQDLAKLDWQPDHFLLSFHGIPVKYVERGDPYPNQVARTTTLLQERLQWPEGRWQQTFQSRFGRSEWLQPYTDPALIELAKRGVKNVFVALPGFTSDCLETLDEIGNESREAFVHAGGIKLRACPCLNVHPAWIAAMKSLVLNEGQGWI